MIASRLILAFLLILGLLNPVENNIDKFIGFFIFGFVSFSILKSSKLVLLTTVIFSLLVFAKIRTFDLVIVYASIFGLVLGYLLERLKLSKKLAIWVVIVGFLITSVATSADLRQMLSRDLPLFTYNNDPSVILETYQLMKKGGGYYEAFRIAQISRYAQQIVPGDIWGWRLPTIFYIWTIFPGNRGLAIYILYLALSLAVFYAAFKIGERYLSWPLAILPSYLIFPYLHFAARDQMLLETEWWSMLLFIIGLYALIKKRWFLTTLLFCLTVVVRELYILPIGLMFIFAFFKKRRLVPVFLIPLLAFLFLFVFHIMATSAYIDSWGTIISPRTIPFGSFFVQQTLAFASWEYLLFAFRPFFIFLLLACLGCLYVFKRFDRSEAIFLLLAFFPFPLAFLRIGTVPYNDYWGIIYMPLAIMLAALSAGFVGSKLKS